MLSDRLSGVFLAGFNVTQEIFESFDQFFIGRTSIEFERLEVTGLDRALERSGKFWKEVGSWQVKPSSPTITMLGRQVVLNFLGCERAVRILIRCFLWYLAVFGSVFESMDELGLKVFSFGP